MVWNLAVPIYNNVSNSTMNSSACEQKTQKRFRTCAVVFSDPGRVATCPTPNFLLAHAHDSLLHGFFHLCCLAELCKHDTGRFIDAHDLIFRFNLAPTQGYEKHAGSRTSYYVLHELASKSHPVSPAQR